MTLRDRLQWAGLGALCSFGALGNMALVADPLAWAWAVCVWTVYRRRPPLWALVLAGLIALTALWSDHRINTLFFAGRLVALTTIVCNLPGRDARAMVLGAAALLLPQAVLLGINIDVPRPRGLSANASQVSSSGLMLWMAAPLQGMGWLGAGVAIAHLGIGLGRTALLAAAVFGVMTISRRRMAAGVALGAVIVLAATLQGQWDRFLPFGDAAERSLAVRNDLLIPLTATASPPTPTPVPVQSTPSPMATPVHVIVSAAPGTYLCYGGDCARPAAPILRVPEPVQIAVFDWGRMRGYGWGSYVASTGQQRPHNLIVLTWYEMGLLSAVPFGLVGWAMWRRLLPWKAWLPLLVLSLLTEEMTGRPEGFYMITLGIAPWIGHAARAAPGSLRAQFAR